MTVKEKLSDAFESVIIMLVMLFVFLPVRVLFVRFVSPDWFGSFGLVSLVVVVLVLLAKYQKLGWFGKIYWRQITKVHKGKRRILTYFSIAFMVYFWGFTALGINYASNNQEIIDLRVDVEKQIAPENQAVLETLEKNIENKDVQGTAQVLKDMYEKIPPEFILIAIPIYLGLPLIDFTIWSLLVSMLNDFTNGWFLHFSTVLFVESLEMVGVMVYTYFMTKYSKQLKKEHR